MYRRMTVREKLAERERKQVEWAKHWAAQNERNERLAEQQAQLEQSREQLAQQNPTIHVSGICEHSGCGKPVYKSIYAFGYLAGMCREHYETATQKDRDDAVRFQYAER